MFSVLYKLHNITRFPIQCNQNKHSLFDRIAFKSHTVTRTNKFYNNIVATTHMSKRTMSTNGTTHLKQSPNSNWSILASVNISAQHTLTKYQSKRTQLQVVRCNIPGPIVNGYFTLATESLCDDGCPHTLEHLVFMGSQLYPYKGILDQLANRCLSQGTNAWTDIDHTAYTLETVGSEGFLQLLPVYLDHILYPTLNDTAYDTEVHHITKDATNAGVVYSEMQARENNSDSIMERAMYRTLYEHGKSGYASETGGMLYDIRTTLSNDVIKRYHQSYYQPSNLTLIITGNVDDTQLFDILNKYEDQQILSKPAYKHIERPFSTPVQPITQTVQKTIEFASDDETVGYVELGFFIVPYNQFETKLALSILFDYFTANSTSYLQQIFCECAEPYCNSVDYNLTMHKYSVHTVEFDNVPTEKLSEITPLFFKSLREHAIDLQRIHTSINKYIRSTADTLETNVHEYVCRIAIPDFLYCNTTQQQDELQSIGDTLQIYNILLTKPITYWTELLNKYIVQNNYVSIIAKPSKALGKQQQQTEQQRIAQQKQTLLQSNPNALTELDTKLQHSIKQNSIPVPDRVIQQFPVPDITKVNTIDIFTVKQGYTTKSSDNKFEPVQSVLKQQNIQFDQIPYTVQLDHIPSQFISVRLLLDTIQLTPEQRLLLPLYRELMFESNIYDSTNNKVIPYNEIIDLLEQVTVNYDNSTGLHSYRYTVGQVQQYISVQLKVELKYTLQALLQLLHNIVYNVQYSIDRVTTCIKRMLSDIPSIKNDGSAVLKAISNQQNFDSDSNIYHSNFIRQQLYLKQKLQQITEHNDTSVLQQLQQLTTTITDSSRIKMHVVLDVTKHDETLYSTIASFVPNTTKVNKIATVNEHIIPASKHYITDTTHHTDLIAISAVESNYLLSTIPLNGLTYNDLQTIAAIRVCIEYLTALEGPMWKRIRGLGLSYSYSIRIDIDTNLLYFSLFKSTSLMNAYIEAHNIVNEFVTQKHSFTEIDLIAAKNSLANEILSSADTIASAAEQQFIHSLRGLQSDYIPTILKHIQNVTATDCVNVLKQYVMPVFSANARIAITANPNNTDNIVSEFKQRYNRMVNANSDLYVYFTGQSVEIDDSEDVEGDSSDEEGDSSEESESD